MVFEYLKETMRLTSLEIKGFKSFADKTILNFDKNIIGVVGPNGSGKSNIVDAIRWVLGEQKGKELRLEKMADVIFNGTKKRKSGSVAKVTLTFDNTKNVLPTEYQDVSITRLLYRNGESEYRLNDIPCRLKDIRALFLDSGIGSNSYAIISLGMVDDILQDKEGSRRKMFEQAAGISKYKTRKKETLNKLKNTSADLERIQDLLFEIEGNLKQLEKQARRTEKYYKLKEKYKNHSIQLAVKKTDSLKTTFQDLKTSIQDKQVAYESSNAEFNKVEAEIEHFKKSFVDEEQELSKVQKALNELVEKIRKQENEKGLIKQNLSFLGQNQNQLAGRIKDSTKRLEEIKLKLETMEVELKSIHDLHKVSNERFKEAEDFYLKLETLHHSAKVRFSSSQEAKIEQEKEIFELEKLLAIQGNNLENLQNEMANNSLLNEEDTKDLDEIKSQLIEIESEKTKLENEIASLADLEASHEQQLVMISNEMEKHGDALDKIEKQIYAKTNEKELLKSLVEKLEGFPESIKYLSKNDAFGKLPILSDIILCDDAYRAVIEEFLGTYLHYLVVENVADASAAIKLLSSNQKGKANFFILNEMQAMQTANINIPEAKPAKEILKIESKYQKLSNLLFHNVFIVEDDQKLLEISAAYPEFIFLSPKNTLIKKQCMISGGSVGLFEGKKLGRKKNFELIKEALIQLDKDAKAKQAILEKLQKDKENVLAASVTDKLDKLKLNAISLNQRWVEQNTRREEIEKKHATALEREKVIHVDISAYNAKLEKINADLKIKQVNLQELVSKLTEEDTNFSDSEIELEDARKEKNRLQIELIQLQNRINSLENDKQFLLTRQTELSSQIENENSSLQNETETKEQLSNNQQIIESDLLKLYEDRKEVEANLRSVEQVYFGARSKITDREDVLRNLRKTMNAQAEQLAQQKERFTEIKIKLNGVSERLQIEFNTSFEQALKQTFEEELELDALEESVEKIRLKIERFGEINPMALEAFKEMKERFDVINQQRNDILDAKESLLETIREIEETATTQFMEAFVKIREHFKTVFRSLFTKDDNCDLILLDEDSPLDSQIDIMAMPKGKKPKSLSQLSGGEKTLTATALLFSLYLLKPAPFCIFDEVDAPLDDANVLKFNKIIKTFSKESQFIIITHNKMTMAEVDVIYGIYMEEMGVSNVSQVSFNNLDFDPVLETIN